MLIVKPAEVYCVYPICVALEQIVTFIAKLKDIIIICVIFMTLIYNIIQF